MPSRSFSGPNYYVEVRNPEPGDLNDWPLVDALNRLRRELNASRRHLRGKVR